MRHLLVLLLVATFVFSSLEIRAKASRDQDRPLRPVHTFSIVCRDPATGELGVAVQSHWFSVGSIVAWAEAGVGAVATQSIAEPAYGPRLLDRLRGGQGP